MILLTGGLGFIGSHTAVVLQELNCKIVIMDNLSNSKIDVLDKIKQLSKVPSNITYIYGDLENKTDVQHVFSTFKITKVIHFASLKSVSESIYKPLLYYKTNLNALINLLEVMNEHLCTQLLFSSSATIYGSLSQSPLHEKMPVGINITNPYGETKYFQEKMLNDYAKSNPAMFITILRYFNPVAASPIWTYWRKS